MKAMRIGIVFLSVLLHCATASSAETEVAKSIVPSIEPSVGSWTFSGMVTNESGDKYGYFFQMQRQGADFHAKTALIDGQNNKLVLFYEGDARIEQPESLNWHVGRSFIRYNPINESWIFGVKDEKNTGFNFKVDMLKQASEAHEKLELRPGIALQALQTSRLNGHIRTGGDAKEEFVTGNNAWFGKLWFTKDQTAAHDISTTFCRLNNDNGFYAANLKEADATGAAIAGWRDPMGNQVRMSQFLSIKALDNKQCLLSLGLPKLNLKLMNTLEHDIKKPLSIAGFSEDTSKGFCVVTEQSFDRIKESAAKEETAKA